MITLIAAIGPNNELGLGNRLLWEIPEDLRHFKSYTMGKPVVMGRKTFESIGGRPLPGRTNIVVTGRHYHITGVITAPDIASALSFSKDCQELVVIGGASVYSQAIGLADKLVITHVPRACTADTFFPKIGAEWGKTAQPLLDGTDSTVVYYERAICES